MIFSRDRESQKVIFLSTWHLANMRFAAQLQNKHHSIVQNILWDTLVDGQTLANPWYRRHYRQAVHNQTRDRFVIHEAFFPDQVIGLNCVVPSEIPEEDLWELMRISGQYRGLSPAKPVEYGRFEVVTIRPRGQVVHQREASREKKRLEGLAHPSSLSGSVE